MTGLQLRTALKRLGLTQMEASRRLGVAGPTVRRWLAGSRRIPEPVAILIRTWLAHPDVMPPSPRRARG